MVYGGSSQKKRGADAAGEYASVTWKGGGDSLGFFTAETETERAAVHMANGEALAGLSALSELLAAALPEGEAKPALYDAAETLLDMLGNEEVWPALFIRWELGLLTMLGYGLDLENCAVSGANDGLTHVSPKSGRAVRGSDAGAFLDRLLAAAAIPGGKHRAGDACRYSQRLSPHGTFSRPAIVRRSQQAGTGSALPDD